MIQAINHVSSEEKYYDPKDIDRITETVSVTKAKIRCFLSLSYFLNCFTYTFLLTILEQLMILSSRRFIDQVVLLISIEVWNHSTNSHTIFFFFNMKHIYV